MDVRAGRGKVAYNRHWWGWGEIESLEKKINEQTETQRNRKKQEKRKFGKIKKGRRQGKRIFNMLGMERAR